MAVPEGSTRGTNYFPLIPSTSPEFEELFTDNVGSTPQRCFKIMLLITALYTIAGVFFFAPLLDYCRYYITNNTTTIALMNAFVTVVRFFAKAFLFPFLGTLTDRVGRKTILVPCAWMGVLGSLMWTFIPSLHVMGSFAVLYTLRDAGGILAVPAYIRDLFPADSWEREKGGYTHIMAIIGFVNGLVGFAAFIVAIGLMYIMKSEYDDVKDICPEDQRCIPEGQYSKNSFWAVDGVLRLNCIIGLVFSIAGTLVTQFLLPETLPPGQMASQQSLTRLVGKQSIFIATPWRACRIFATPKLRWMIATSMLGQMGAIAFNTTALSLVERHDLESLDFGPILIGSIVGGLPIFCLAQCLVPKFGDLWAVWVPGALLAFIGGMLTVFTPKGSFVVLNVAAVFIFGPSGVLMSQKDGVISKLMPPDSQATWRGAKNFIFHMMNAVLVFPLTGLFSVCRNWNYPFDMAPAMLPMVSCLLATLLSWYMAMNMSPKKMIDEGDPLCEFYASQYAREGDYSKRELPSSQLPAEQIPKSAPAPSVEETVHDAPEQQSDGNEDAARKTEASTSI